MNTLQIPRNTFQVNDTRPVMFFMSIPGVSFHSYTTDGITYITFSHTSADIMKEAERQYSNEYEAFTPVS